VSGTEPVETPVDVVRRGIGHRTAIALAFGSSAAVLVLELVSLRLIAPYLGLTLETNTAVIGVALAAIATGAALGGRFADLVPPTRSLGPLLLVAGALVFFILPVVRWTGENVRDGGNGAVFFAVAIALFVPAALLAAVTPMVTKLRLDSLTHTGTVVGSLSAYATVGAIAGTVLTGFVFVAQVPTSTIVLLLGGLIVVSGGVLTIWLRGLRTAAGPLALALAGTGISLVAPRPCAVETAYHCVRVVADPVRATGRTLYLDNLRHSYVDLDDPTHLEFEYIRDFAALVEARWPGPLRALHVGGGGLTMPRYLSATRPGTYNRVYEIDGGVVDIDVERLGARLGDGMNGIDVRVRDGRLGVRSEPADRYDLVVGDAFGGVAVPWHLTTREVVADVRRVLVDGGVYAVNVIDFGSLAFARAEVRTIGTEFPHVAVLGSPEKLAGDAGGNFVLLASDRPLPLDALRAELARNTDGHQMLATPDQIAAFVQDAPLLTDDYAPVDQLLTPNPG
jgi:spermidine synthase